MRELVCNCRMPKCPHSAPLGDRCVGAIVDYARTDRDIRAIGRRQGWRWLQDGRVRRDFCPDCVPFQRGDQSG